jgi:nicotinamide-nucleotide amidase
MTAEIISIGDELLIGQVVNTNASWISEQLNLTGIKVHQVTTISDNREHILTALQEAEKRVDIILLTGGLGPTKDDITKETLCEYFNTQLVFSKEVFKDIAGLFGKRGLTISIPNRKQAEIPATCTPIKNNHGSAAGMWFEKESKIVVSMPGVPFEMKPMITGYVIPEIQKRYKTHTIVHKTVLTQGIGESWLAQKIEAWEDKLPENIKPAYLPQPGIVRIRLTALGENKKVLENQVDEEIKKLLTIIPEYFFGFDDDELFKIVGELLRKNGQTVSTAESCSGGYIAHLITSVAGSSGYFKGSVVAYANEIKQQLLGVKEKSLIDFGAVSEGVVKEMAEGVRVKFNTDYAIATSGIAGPGGGTKDKPVGTTWIAIATPNKTIVQHFLMGEHRERNIRKTALTALNMLRKELLS